MTDPVFDPTALETARERITKLFETFVPATGVPATTVSLVVAGDRAFLSRYLRVNLTFGSYDMVAGRFSALWPDGTDWPAGVPRPAPAEIPDHLRTVYDDRARANLPAEEPAQNG